MYKNLRILQIWWSLLIQNILYFVLIALQFLEEIPVGVDELLQRSLRKLELFHFRTVFLPGVYVLWNLFLFL